MPELKHSNYANLKSYSYAPSASYFWTMTPYGDGNSTGVYIGNIPPSSYSGYKTNGAQRISYELIKYTVKLRPVINLVEDVMVTGCGTNESPYVVEP